MTVAATQERMEKAMAFLKRRADRGLPCPTNKEIGLVALKMGTQRNQPFDRTEGIKWPKAEHGAVIIAALEYCGLVAVKRGRNWREITILATGQVLQRRCLATDGSGWQRTMRSAAA